MDEVGHGIDQGVEEGCCRLGVGALDELHEGELRGPIDGNEEVELAFGGSHLGNIDVEVADDFTLAIPASFPMPARMQVQGANVTQQRDGRSL